jgi:hypothetical protein
MPNEAGYDKIKYGQEGKKTGYAKVGQARNQPGFIPRGQRPGGTPGYPGGNDGGGMQDGEDGGAAPGGGNTGIGQGWGGNTVAGSASASDPANAANFLQTLNPKMQARVAALLGDSYDPGKPLQQQMFNARWSGMNAQQRHAWAQNQRDNGNWVLDGAKMGTVHGVYDAFQEMQSRTLGMQQQTYNDLYATMSGGGTGRTDGQIVSGPAWSPAEIDSMRASLAATMAANPSFATPEQVASFEHSWAQGADQYKIAASMGARLQHLAAQLGITPDKILPPDIDARLAQASLGYNQNGQPLDNIPSAADVARYPGLAIAYANMPHLSPQEAHNAFQDAGGRAAYPGARERGRVFGERDTAKSKPNTAYGDEPSSMLYQPAFSSDEIAADYI